MENVLSELETLKQDIKDIVDTKFQAIESLIKQYTEHNKSEHEAIKNDVERLRTNQAGIYERLNVVEKDVDVKTTAVSIRLDKRLDAIEKAPGEAALKQAEKAADNRRKLWQGIFSGIASALLLMLIIWLLTQVFGAPPP